MNRPIGLCPNCNQMGRHTELTADVLQRTLKMVVGGVLLPEATNVQGAWCPRCEAPYLVLWQADLDTADQAELAGGAAELLDLLEKESRR